MALTKVTTEVIDDSIRIGSGSLNVISGSSKKSNIYKERVNEWQIHLNR